MRWPAWSCALVLLGGAPRPVLAGDGFAHHVVGVRLAPKPEQQANPNLTDFYIDMGKAHGALPGTEFWVYRVEQLAGRRVAIPVGRLETIHVEEAVSVARLDALTMPADHALVDYRTVMVGDAVEPIVGSGTPPLGERPLPAEAVTFEGPLIPELEKSERLVRTFSIPNVVLFDFDKSTLRPEGMAVLEQVAAYIVETGAAQVRVEGHTDSVGTRAYNQGLSQRRADAVKRFLAGRPGVNGRIIVAVGYGETRPVASNATHEGRQRNRRSEITADGRKPARTELDGMRIDADALMPEGTEIPRRGRAEAAPPPASAPEPAPAPAPDDMDAERPFPELARPRP